MYVCVYAWVSTPRAGYCHRGDTGVLAHPDGGWERVEVAIKADKFFSGLDAAERADEDNIESGVLAKFAVGELTREVGAINVRERAASAPMSVKVERLIGVAGREFYSSVFVVEFWVTNVLGLTRMGRVEGRWAENCFTVVGTEYVAAELHEGAHPQAPLLGSANVNRENL